MILDDDEGISRSVENADVVVHLAGRAHILKDHAADPLAEFRAIYTMATFRLAKHAALAGVKRFIFISTVKVLGESTPDGRAFRYDDPCCPEDPYAVSKLEAEEGLKGLAERYDMEIVIIRPPLIYGEGVKGNFARLMRLSRLSLPLPFGSIINKRSLVSAENIVDLIVVCLRHPNAGNKTFLVSDGDDISTATLLVELGNTGGFRSHVVRFPPWIIENICRFSGKLDAYYKLSNSLTVDIEYARTELGWTPPYSVKASLKKCWMNIDSSGEQ